MFKVESKHNRQTRLGTNINVKPNREDRMEMDMSVVYETSKTSRETMNLIYCAGNAYLIYCPDGLVVRFSQLHQSPISPLTFHRYDSPFGFTSQIRRGRVFESRFGPSSFFFFLFLLLLPIYIILNIFRMN